jgi:hypothetical protein
MIAELRPNFYGLKRQPYPTVGSVMPGVITLAATGEASRLQNDNGRCFDQRSALMMRA